MCRPEAMRRDALLLDFGGVMTRTLFECHAEIEEHFALPRGGFPWRGALEPARDELWRAVSFGKTSDQEYWRQRIAVLSERTGRSLAMSDVIAAACGADPNRIVRPEALAMVRKAKAAGCRVVVLSNDLERIYGRAIVGRLDILAEVDGVVDGSASGVHKPSPEAFARGLAALGRATERTVFVDDQPRNVAAATALGIVGVNFDIRRPGPSFAQAARLLSA
jgi:putative hydrolase of the HAD superfamily